MNVTAVPPEEMSSTRIPRGCVAYCPAGAATVNPLLGRQAWRRCWVMARFPAYSQHSRSLLAPMRVHTQHQDGRATLNPRLVTPTAQGAGEGRSKDLHPPPCRHKREELKLPPSILRLPRTEEQGRGSHTTSTLPPAATREGSKSFHPHPVAAPAQ